jgi:hypothetical protein
MAFPFASSATNPAIEAGAGTGNPLDQREKEHHFPMRFAGVRAIRAPTGYQAKRRRLDPDSGRFLSISVKPVRQDEKGRSPKSHKDSKTLGMRLGFPHWATRTIPNGNRADDGGKSQNEARLT